MDLSWFRQRPEPDEVPEFRHFRGDLSKLRFATRAELEYARRFDFYRVPWEYEPHTFVLARREDGGISEAFTPDFYLPKEDLHIEVTLLKQSLVTRKNRKLRKLRELYPEVQVKLYYARDFEVTFAELVQQHQPRALPAALEVSDPPGLTVPALQIRAT